MLSCFSLTDHFEFIYLAFLKLLYRRWTSPKKKLYRKVAAICLRGGRFWREPLIPGDRNQVAACFRCMLLKSCKVWPLWFSIRVEAENVDWSKAGFPWISHVFWHRSWDCVLGINCFLWLGDKLCSIFLLEKNDQALWHLRSQSLSFKFKTLFLCSPQCTSC